jgi:hypothetical protein
MKYLKWVKFQQPFPPKRKEKVSTNYEKTAAKKHHVLEIGVIMTRYKGMVKIRCITVMRCTQVLSNQNPETAKVNTGPHRPLT